MHSYHPVQASPSYRESQPYQPPTPSASYQRVPYHPRTTGMDPFTAPASPSSPYHSSSPAPSASTSYHPSIQHSMMHPSSYMSSHLAHHYDSFDVASSAILDSNVQPMAGDGHVIVHDFGPQEGAQGTQITIKCDVNFPTTAPHANPDASSPDPIASSSTGKALRVVFGQHPVQTAVQLLTLPARIGGSQTCQLSAFAPSWSSTGRAGAGRTNRVAVYVQVLAETHAIVDTVFIGDFAYASTGPRNVPYHSYSPANSLKRAGDALESHRPSPNEHLHRRVFSNGPNVPSPELHQYAQLPPQYQPNPQMEGPASAYSSPHFNSNGTLPSVAQPAPYSANLQPSLMRSTQVLPPAPAANPYVMSSGQKANLELTGDLSGMSKGWSHEEWHCRRRLVQFWRRQDGTTISAAFRPLSQGEYPQAQNSIIISCIFREDKNACYVTSVDTIYLLEALVGTRFTVEEKNRIRRNLEGFRPITVSKSKPGSEDFFKLIMGFPNPKPRNIEKDVKVFPWDILGSALKKIIGKYSASYAYSGNNTMPPVQPALQSYPVPPAPVPLQPSSGDASYAAGTAPQLQSHTSSDSSVYAQSFSTNGPQTPNMSHAQIDSSKHYRAAPTPQAEKHDPYIGLSEVHRSPYGSTQGQNPYWPTTFDPNLSSPSGPVNPYGTLTSSLSYHDHPHHLPHMHEGVSTEPNANDLRVIYPAMTA